MTSDSSNKASAAFSSLSPAERQQLIAYFAGFVLLGISAALLGPTLNQLAANTGSSLGDISILFTMRSIGYLIGAILSAVLYERFGGHRVLAVAFIGVAASLFLTPTMPTLWLLSAITVLSRMSGGIIDTGENTLIVWALGKRVGPFMNALHLTFGIGAFAAPLLVAWALTQFEGINAAYWVVAVLSVPLALFLWRVPNPTRPNQTTPKINIAAHTDPPTQQRKFIPLLLILLFYFCYVGGEVTMGGWLYNYALASKVGNEVSAATLVSGFWGAYTIGRLISIPAALRWSPMQILLISSIAVAISAVLMWLVQGNLPLTWVAVLAVGLGMAALFPTMLAYAESRLTMTGRITSGIMASASIGATIAPYLVGQIFTRSGPAAVPIAVLASGALMCGVLAVLRMKKG